MKLTFLSALALIFITLKLVGVIEWSWWLVLLPLWGGLAAVLIVFLAASLVLVLMGWIARIRGWYR